MIIGGTRGIGRALVDLLLTEGHDVMAVGRSMSSGDGGRALSFESCDMLSREGLLQSVQLIEKRRPSLIVYVAGAHFEEHGTSSLSVERNLHLHCLAPFLLARRVRHAAHFVYVGSQLPYWLAGDLASTRADRYHPLLAYSFSKACAVMMLHAYRQEMALSHLTCFMPGATRTGYGRHGGFIGKAVWVLNRFARSASSTARGLYRDIAAEAGGISGDHLTRLRRSVRNSDLHAALGQIEEACASLS